MNEARTYFISGRQMTAMAIRERLAGCSTTTASMDEFMDRAQDAERWLDGVFPPHDKEGASK